MGFELEYVTRFAERQELLFRNYAGAAGSDLRPIETELYRLCRSHDIGSGGDRRSRVLRSVATRGRVDYHPSVSDLRNRIDEGTTYRPPPETGRAGLGAAMEHDVLELVALRDAVAREEGFGSYAELAMSSEGLDIDAVREFSVKTRDETIEACRGIVQLEQLSLEFWFDGLERIGGADVPDLLNAVTELTTRLGLGGIAERISWIVRSQPIYGAAFAISVPDDVRVLLGRTESLVAVATAYHELGHALAHAANMSDGIFKTWEVTTDETIAVVIERVAAAVALTDDNRRKLELIELLEAARLATSLSFEFEVADNPHDVRELFGRWYTPLVPVSDPAIWALDTFRSIDPFHIQGYLIGNVVAEATITYLTDRYPNNPEAWGQWLVTNYLAAGRSVSLSERLNSLEEYRPTSLDPLLVPQ